MPITLAIRRELIEGYVPLCLHVAWRLLHAGLPFEEALQYKVDIYRYTTLDDGKVLPDHPPAGWRNEGWERVMDELREVFTRHEGEAGSSAIEREGYEVLRPVLEDAFERDVAAWPRIEDRPYGFFTGHVTSTWLPGRTLIGMHLGNPFAPASPFADLPARARELRRLADDLTAEHPEVTEIGTGSWLNSLAPFVSLFPPEWAISAQRYPRLVPGKGWWGQFIDRRGGFHKANADHLRRTGQFPYPVLNCTCSIESLRRHLKERFGVA